MAWSPPALERRSWLVEQAGDYAASISHHIRDGTIKSAMGFRRFHLRGLRSVASEWLLIALAYNCRRLHRLQAG